MGGFASGWSGEMGKALQEIGKRLDASYRKYPACTLSLRGIVDDYAGSFIPKIQLYLNSCFSQFTVAWNAELDYSPKGQPLLIRYIGGPIYSANLGILLSGVHPMTPEIANKFSAASLNSLVVEVGGG